MLYISLAYHASPNPRAVLLQSARCLLETPTRGLTYKIGCKDSVKFRFSEENENKFSFLSARKLRISEHNTK